MNNTSQIQSAVTAERPKPEYHVVHAIISATVFGLLGAQLGKWLGRHGSNAERKLAQPIMKWGMGTFGAVLAAYSSFKADERVAGDLESRQSAEATQRIMVQSAPIASQAESPGTHVDTTGAQLHGRVAESAARHIA